MESFTAKNKNGKTKRPKRKKSLRQGGKPKHLKKHGKSNKPSNKSSENEINFNSEEYHKKQHSF